MNASKSILIISLIALLFGCNTNKKISLLQKYAKEPIQEIQINPVPHPFHMMMPYVIWVNGKKLEIPRKDIIIIAEQFNLCLDPPENTADLHNGFGWQKPLVRLD